MDIFTVYFCNSLICILFVIVILYNWFSKRGEHFIKLKVQYDKPFPLFGSFKNFYLQTESYYNVVSKLYSKYKNQSYFGMYEFQTPVLVVTDPNIIRCITVTNFDHFMNRSQYFNDSSLFELSLLMLKDQGWREMRELLAPVFAPKNVHDMFYLIEECCTTAMDYLKANVTTDGVIQVDLEDYLKRFVLDVSTSTAFGIKTNSFQLKNCALYNKIVKLMYITPSLLLKLLCFGNFPTLMKFLRISFLSKDFFNYFYSLVRESIEFRIDNNIKHFDIIDILIDKTNEMNSLHCTQNGSRIKDCSKHMSKDNIIAQCMTFLFDGLGKIALLTHSLILELAVNQRAQDKLIREIDTVQISMGNMKVSYCTLDAMEYLDMVIFETIRKWSTTQYIDRVCTKPFRIRDELNDHYIDLKKDDRIWIPIFNIHRDPAYFSNSEKFEPERFSEQRRNSIRPYTFLPFGAGPRHCIGTKFGLMQIKAAIFSLLCEFRIEPESKDITETVLDNKGFFVQPKPFKVRLCRRNKLPLSS